MPRTARASRADICYHVVTRGNSRSTVFHDESDYAAFLRLMSAAADRVPMRVLAYCLMPNHVHLVLWPCSDGHLSRWMHWLLTSHVRRQRLRYQTTGRIWQGRFKAFPVQSDWHLLVVLRYVERNPLRAALVSAAADWRWSSLRERSSTLPHGLVTPPPIRMPRSWADCVQQPQHDCEVADVRRSVLRDRPFGDEAWVRGTAERLGLLYSLRPRGWPRILST